jgi:hypothetical protein
MVWEVCWWLVDLKLQYYSIGTNQHESDQTTFTFEAFALGALNCVCVYAVMLMFELLMIKHQLPT